MCLAIWYLSYSLVFDSYNMILYKKITILS